jgi:hypothetical protein
MIPAPAWLIAAATPLALCACGVAGPKPQAQRRLPAFRWLQPSPPPRKWKLARLPSGVATLAYPPAWRPIRTDPGTVSVALLGPGDLIVGYLNATPQQWPETLRNWPTFRVSHVGEEGSRQIRVIAARHGLAFRSAHGSCVEDSYLTTRARYREIACLVAGTRGTTVVVGAALAADWPKQAATIERAISSFQT